ncbi:hypothetical protein DWB68_15345 [Galactobacter valiniphilus]|uniref:Putative amidase domain-containing protein n=1 Tax=Galactobacter valiniphilus TaxID=2676122 RepID=A0A399J9S2_9MICC|nr:amidase domain-containing protein [Galactobacter valiniphilus]RII40939.1 hypothetical protein DWB68_15345 [Galactobacter valiniphilus]
MLSLVKYIAVAAAAATALASGVLTHPGTNNPQASLAGHAQLVSADTKQLLEDSITKTLATVYTTEDSSVSITGTSGVRTVGAITKGSSAEDAVDELATEVPMTDSAAAQVEEEVASERALETVDLPEGLTIPTVVATEVTPESISVEIDKNDGDRVVDTTTILAQTDENGVTSQSRVVATSVFSESDTLESFHIYTDGDFADQAELDPAFTDQEGGTDDTPGSDEGITLDLGAESPNSDGSTTRDRGSEDSSQAVPAAQQAGSISLAGMSASNKAAAVAYARKHALSYNSNYHKYSGKDCTNFVSQAMRAGGWSQTGGTKWDVGAWWHGGVWDSNAWTVAETFYKFTRNVSKRGAYLSRLAQTGKGDVIQAKRQKASDISHTMIVTKKVGTTLYVSYHSNDRLDYPLAKFMASADFKGATYFAHRI